MKPAFDTVGDFLAMSGYGVYVWSSMLLCFGAVLLNAWLAKRALAKARLEARRRLEMNP